MKLSIILGTRPEIIKFSSIIRECERLKLDYFILHTGGLVLTNSGGVKGETCVLRVPCVTLRDNTEILDIGSNVLAGSIPTQILKNVDYMLNRSNAWENPFGDGNAGKRIIQKVREKFD